MRPEFGSEQSVDGMLERAFTVGDIPGILWTPATPAGSPAPLILLGHPGQMTRMHSRLSGRARSAVAQGYAAAAIELPWTGDRPASPAMDRARADLRRAVDAGRGPDPDVIDRLVLPLVDQGAAEWRATIDALQELDEIGEGVGLSGGVISIGVRLARTEPRLVAASLFAGSVVPAQILDEAREVTIPLQVLLQWDDEGNDRQTALDLFDAFGSTEKTLIANLGGHTGVPTHAGEAAAAFFARHVHRGQRGRARDPDTARR